MNDKGILIKFCAIRLTSSESGITVKYDITEFQ